MMKCFFKKSAVLTAVAVCLLLSAACGSGSAENNNGQTSFQSEDVTDRSQSEPASSGTETKPEQPGASSETPGKGILKINGGADGGGIYSIVVKLADRAADKGVIEMVYYGAKGSPQENSVVNTFRIEYFKEEAGTYEIGTFFDGEVYQNLHHKDEMKVVNTFGAALRAGSVIISYTPDGGETQEIFRADAAYFAG